MVTPIFSLSWTLIAITSLMYYQRPCLGFSQGSAIVNAFESSYCESGLDDMHRGPLHYDMVACGGVCRAQIASRTMYTIRTNSSEYSANNNITVRLLANGRAGANILGFVMLAIAESGRTAGSWVVVDDDDDPEVLRATCDSTLEGQVVFHARSSPSRVSVDVVWNPRSTNYGRIIFRAWIVQRHDAIFTVDSAPLTNPLNGADSMTIETYFSSLLRNILDGNDTSNSRSMLSNINPKTNQQPPARMPRPRGRGTTNGNTTPIPTTIINSTAATTSRFVDVNPHPTQPSFHRISGPQPSPNIQSLPPRIRPTQRSTSMTMATQNNQSNNNRGGGRIRRPTLIRTVRNRLPSLSNRRKGDVNSIMPNRRIQQPRRNESVSSDTGRLQIDSVARPLTGVHNSQTRDNVPPASLLSPQSSPSIASSPSSLQSPLSTSTSASFSSPSTSSIPPSSLNLSSSSSPPPPSSSSLSKSPTSSSQLLPAISSAFEDSKIIGNNSLPQSQFENRAPMSHNINPPIRSTTETYNAALSPINNIPLLKEFEDSFHARMTSGFNLSSDDPFSGFNSDTFSLTDFFPTKSLPDLLKAVANEVNNDQSNNTQGSSSPRSPPIQPGGDTRGSPVMGETGSSIPSNSNSNPTISQFNPDFQGRLQHWQQKQGMGNLPWMTPMINNFQNVPTSMFQFPTPSTQPSRWSFNMPNNNQPSASVPNSQMFTNFNNFGQFPNADQLLGRSIPVNNNIQFLNNNNNNNNASPNSNFNVNMNGNNNDNNNNNNNNMGLQNQFDLSMLLANRNQIVGRNSNSFSSLIPINSFRQPVDTNANNNRRISQNRNMMSNNWKR